MTGRVELLMGCGHDRTKKVRVPGHEAWSGLVTVDINPDTRPDVLHDLASPAPLPFPDSYADEMHFYDVLEHLGAQGDWRTFFAQFSEYWRVLKPGGRLFGICPRWDQVWAFGDPGHTRVIQVETLSFLSQRQNREQLDGERKTNRTDYRFVWKGDFETRGFQMHDVTFSFHLQAVK
jgi:hypothetical protein